MKIPTYIVGSGGLGRGVLETLKLIMNHSRNWEMTGFIDDNEKIHGKFVNGIPILGGTNYLLQRSEISNVILGIADPDVKEKLWLKLSKNENLLFPNLIHPAINLNGTIEMGYGNIISENVSFSSNILLKNFTLLHFNSSVGHDVTIENYSTVYPGVNLSGFSNLEEKAQVGTNACVLPGVKVGESAFVGAGSVVNANVANNTIVVGSPARVMKK